MSQTNDRSIYYLTIDNDEAYVVSLTTDQVNLLKWLIREHGFDDLLSCEKLSINTPIVI